MTIRFLKSLQGNYEGQIVSGLAGAEETRLIGLGYASYDLDGEASNVIDAKFKTTANGDINGLMAGDGMVIPFAWNEARTKDIELLNLPPLIQAPLWGTVASGAVAWGKRIRHSNGMLIECTTAGTNAAVEPTYTESAVMVSGTATWIAVAIKSRLNADGYAVPIITLSNTLPAGLVSTPMTVSSGNLSKVLDITAPNATDSNGGSWSWTFNTGTTTSYISTAPLGCNTWNRVIEFLSDSPKLSISFYGSGTSRAVFYVDDYPIEEDTTYPLPTAGTESHYVIDWSGIKKMRKYRIELANQTRLKGINVDAYSTLSPALQSGIEAIILTDSYGDTSKPDKFSHNSSLVEILARKLGVRYSKAIAQGGCGYYTSGAPKFNSVQFLQDSTNITQLNNWNPQLVVLLLGLNDNSVLPQSLVITNALQTWQTLRAMYPSAVITVVGAHGAAQLPTGTSAATILSLEADLLAAFNTWNDQRSLYVTQAVNNLHGAMTYGMYYWGGGSTTHGTSDYYISTDGTHPSPIGAEYISTRLASLINAGLARLSS